MCKFFLLSLLSHARRLGACIYICVHVCTFLRLQFFYIIQAYDSFVLALFFFICFFFFFSIILISIRIQVAHYKGQYLRHGAGIICVCVWRIINFGV